MRTSILIIITFLLFGIMLVFLLLGQLSNTISPLPAVPQENLTATQNSTSTTTSSVGTTTSTRIFHGPTSAPHIKGPSGPPPA